MKEGRWCLYNDFEGCERFRRVNGGRWKGLGRRKGFWENEEAFGDSDTVWNI